MQTTTSASEGRTYHRVGKRTGRTAASLSAGLLTLFALVVPFAVPASALPLQGVGLSIVPRFPPSVTVGDTNVDAQLAIGNPLSVGVGPVTVTEITLFPACGDAVAGPCNIPDPGVFALSATGVGLDRACTGVVFTITGPDASGRYVFTPSSPIILGISGAPDAGCTIGFTLSVLKVPAIDAAPADPGLDTRQYATVNGSAVTVAAPIGTLVGTGTGTSITRVLQAAPTINTVATPAAILTGTISDTATVTGVTNGPVPTGTVAFTAFGPDDLMCTGPAAPGSSAAVALAPKAAGPPPTAAATTPGFVPTLPGAYRWVAVYSGDANYTTVTSPCGALNETSTVTRPVASITTMAADTTLGGTISDTATVSTLPVGAPQPTGRVTFNLYANENCTGTPIFSSTNDLANGVATSGTFPAPNAGSFIWVATYNGDAIYAPVSNACGEAAEISVVLASEIAITTQAPPTVRLGAPLTDTATLSGGTAAPTAPTGTITFNLFGPGDATCTQTPVFSSIVPVTGNGTYTSQPFASAGVGTYRWQATYSGDLNNLPAGPGLCGEPTETTQVVLRPTISIVKDATPATRLEPGGHFTYNLVITNTSTETLTLTSLVDDTDTSITTDTPVDLSGQGTCTTAIGTVLAPGGTYTCTFDRDFLGKAGDTRNDRVTVTGVANDQTPVTANDDATVKLTPVAAEQPVKPVKRLPALPRTGSAWARLAAAAAALIALGGLLVAGSRLASSGSLPGGGPGVSGRIRRHRA